MCCNALMKVQSINTELDTRHAVRFRLNQKNNLYDAGNISTLAECLWDTPWGFDLVVALSCITVPVSLQMR